MTAGVLSMIGVNMHQNHNPNPGNPKGAYEDVNFIHLTIQIKKELDRGVKMPDIKERHSPRIKELVEKRKGTVWGFKSALTHYCLPAFMPYLIQPHFVFVFRNLYYNAESFVVHQLRRYKQQISLSDALINMGDSTKVLANKAASFPKVPKTFVTYEDIKTNPIGVANGLCNFLQLEMTPEKEQAISEFIDPNFSTIS